MKTAALLKKSGNVLYFKVHFSSSPELRRKLRLIKGYRKVASETYVLPFTDEIEEILVSNKFEFNGNYIRYKKWEYEKKNPIKKIPKYKKRDLELRKYQFEGVNHVERRNGRALIADEMGLGKTVQALAWIQLRKEIHKIIIICPSSLKINWKEEFEKWVTRDLSIEIIDGTTPYDLKSDVVIINYDILIHWQEKLEEYYYLACIADELHYCKNPKSQRTTAFKAITKMIPNVIGLTGTPIENDPKEIFYVVNLIDKNIFPNYIRFIEKYCNAKQVDQRIKAKPIPDKLQNDIDTLLGKRRLDIKDRQRLDILSEQYKELKYPTRKIWKTNGVTNAKELHHILSNTIMIRRLKKDVEKELPPKVYSTIHLTINNTSDYKKAEKDFIEYIKKELNTKTKDQLERQLKNFVDDPNYITNKQLKEAKQKKIESVSKAPALAKIQELKMLAAQGKMQELIQWIHDFLESGEKLIVFAINKIIIEQLMTEFPDAVKIDGSVTKKKRNEVVKKFQNDPNCKLFIGNIKAAGVGLTLTASSNVVITQFPWNPGELLQAEDRAHRITQTRKVTIYKLIAKNTIEDRIVQLLQYKQDEIDRIIDGKDVKNRRKLVHLLIESYNK